MIWKKIIWFLCVGPHINTGDKWRFSLQELIIKYFTMVKLISRDLWFGKVSLSISACIVVEITCMSSLSHSHHIEKEIQISHTIGCLLLLSQPLINIINFGWEIVLLREDIDDTVEKIEFSYFVWDLLLAKGTQLFFSLFSLFKLNKNRMYQLLSRCICPKERR